ncbi:MAG: tRNA (adenosine(37)-N6)-threonylcarbamoyltransferase complex transferase subunit TsaD [Ruminococcus sp.]|jgi:N6-L-threonylcarbamoyladenine synthase|nr:tRNA (adenosine(37)-N6)-threonylcarbamoyltransferase complex transferase subunit TsaD [Ruminococcus sp.]
MKILAIETSCDETAAAVVENGRVVLSNIIASQADIHGQFGGVVPEIASRLHAETILETVKTALETSGKTLSEMDKIAVTAEPGLIGALLVGLSFAKTLAYGADKPIIEVNHIAGHIAANYIDTDLKPPFLSLVVSGGHTSLVGVDSFTEHKRIGKTRDDAAGEAFDKSARVLGFTYPGGVQIDKLAKSGDSNAFRLPKPAVPGFDFSFSGLKTAVINTVHNAEQKGEILNKNDLAASFQKTVAEILSEKTLAAARQFGYGTIALAGGVSANSGIRREISKMCDENGFKLFMPPLSLCGDNAAMIGAEAFFRTAQNAL